MSDNDINKRRHPRVYFKAADMLKLHIVCPSLNQTPFIAKVMNISESGLCFFISRGSDIKINKGDRLVFEKIEDIQIFKTVIKVDMAVRWHFREKILDHQMCGCEFLNMPSNYKNQLCTFIHQQIQKNDLTPQTGAF